MLSRSRCRILVWFSAMFAMALPSIATGQAADAKDRIFFKNGDISSGTLEVVKSDAVTFQGNLTGTVNYNWADIDYVDVMAHEVQSPNAAGRNDLLPLKQSPFRASLKSGALHLDPLKVTGAPESQPAPQPVVAAITDFTVPPPPALHWPLRFRLNNQKLQRPEVWQSHSGPELYTSSPRWAQRQKV